MATWANGAALESFEVRSTPRAAAIPDGRALAAEIEAAFEQPLVSTPQPDLDLTFDDEASPWYTLCEVRGRDRPGLLHAVAAGFAATGVSIHSARVDTRADVVIDRFEVSDVSGRKLDDERKRAAVAAIHGGVHTRARRRHGRWWSGRAARAEHGRLPHSPGEM
jgi:UTP:GlnB (protein PII) uridylyltransferase